MECGPEISIQGLYKSFTGHPVLQGVDLEIAAGEVVAIVGGSGCGKTVLMNCILGQLTPDAGRIRVADHSRPGAPLRDIARLHESERDAVHIHWGVVFQRNALFSGTVFDNIALWLREVKRMEDEDIIPIARRVLEAVGLESGDDFLASGHETLSGGMAKRLAVARALAMDPMVIFYDEPTTGLDPTSSAQIHDLIYATHREPSSDRRARTTVIITHDKDLLNRMEPRTVMLHEGKVFFDGPFKEFEASESEVIRPYFDLMPILDQRAAA